MADDNTDLGEFRYLFYDDFGVAPYKSRAEYEALQEDASFKVQALWTETRTASITLSHWHKGNLLNRMPQR